VVFVAWPCERPALRALVARLLAATAAVCRDLGVEASVDLGERVGVWHATGKLASLGLAHGHGVARHGLALNLAIDDALAGGLALCGSDCTRLANLGALAPLPRPSLRDLARLLARHLDAEHAA
jgi:lipoate-protein ligase B